MSYTNFQVEVLNRHNTLRKRHSAAPLQLDSNLCNYAQEWANTLASRNVMQHRTSRKYGENLYACFGKTNVTGTEVVDAWYKEIKNYTFGSPSPHNFMQVGHFTQVVWKATRKVGVGIAKKGTNVYVVCNYDPHGNFSGQYPLNVTRQ